VPREIIFLNGAPGSGKGVNTPHILQTRGFDSSICVSSLLVSSSFRPLPSRSMRLLLLLLLLNYSLLCLDVTPSPAPPHPSTH